MSLSLSDRHVYGSDIQFWLYLLIPPILCGGLIPLLNVLYLKLATKLNDFENHKTESSFQFNLIGKIQQYFFWVEQIKITLTLSNTSCGCFGGSFSTLAAKVLSFRMINCFCSLYYYAFSGRHPILRLTVQLASFMVVGQLQKHFKRKHHILHFSLKIFVHRFEFTDDFFLCFTVQKVNDWSCCLSAF